MNRRTDVVLKSRQSELGSSYSAAHCFPGFDEEDRQARVCEDDSGAQAIRSTTDDYDVEFRFHSGARAALIPKTA